MDKKSARIRRATRARRKLQELGATLPGGTSYPASHLRTGNCTERF